jgi:membrane protease YdiL (CAAX protease family)
MSDSNTLPALVGLAVAFGGPVLLGSRRPRDPEKLATRVTDQAGLWAVFAAVVSIILFWEGQPLSSIGLQPFQWSSIVWGIALFLALSYIAAPTGTWAIRAAGLSGFERGLSKVVSLPLWLRLVAVVTAGVVEETLFRGFAVERLAMLTGSYGFAGVLSATAAALLHLPFWGVGPVLTFLFTGGLLTAFFIWQQDLLANIVAHTLVDGTGLVIMPLLSRHHSDSSDS